MQTITSLPGRYLVEFEDGCSMELSEKVLIKFIKEEELNLVYDEPDDLVHVCPVNYLADNYEKVIGLWIAKQEAALCEV